MSPDPSPTYRITMNAVTRDWLARLTRRARLFGVHQAFADNVRFIEQKLQTDPLNWGDPVTGLRGLGMTSYRAMHKDLVVVYAVRES